MSRQEPLHDAVDDYLFCGYDARRLDEKQLEAEIAARKLSPESTTNVRALFNKAQERAAWMLAGLTSQKDPNYDYKALFVDTPEAGATAWKKFYDDHKDVFELGTAIEKQLSSIESGRRGSQIVEVPGCIDLHKKFEQHLSRS